MTLYGHEAHDVKDRAKPPEARRDCPSSRGESPGAEARASPSAGGTGRAENQLKDKEIAYKHANVIVEPESLSIEDLGSTKGIFVNGARVPDKGTAPLKAQDRVLVGATELLVLQVAASAEKTAPEIV